MIHVFLIRHGAAEDAAPGFPDALRALSAKGRKRFHKTARSFAGKSGAVDLILTSPLVRAVQTAEILAGEVKHGALSALEELGPGNPAGTALKAISTRARKTGSVALVGHEPQLSQLAAALLRVPAAQAAKIDIRPGAVVRVDVSGLPEAKKAAAKWWIKSRGRHEGLPWRDEKPANAKSKPAPAPEPKKKEPAAKAAAPAEKKSAPAKKKAPPPPPKKSAPKKSAAAHAKPAAAPSKPAARPRPPPPPRKPAVAAKPVSAAAPKPAAAPPRPSVPPPLPKSVAPPPAPQKFMGAPRLAGAPPPRPSMPPPLAPAAPIAAPLPEEDKPSTDDSE